MNDPALDYAAVFFCFLIVLPIAFFLGWAITAAFELVEKYFG